MEWVRLLYSASKRHQRVPYRFFLYTGVGTTTMLLAEIILMMRVYALFGGAGKTLLSLITLTLLLFGFNIVQLLFDLEILDSGQIPIFVESRNVYGCLFALGMSGVAWIVTSSAELLLCILVVWKTVQVKKLKLPARISRLESGQTKTQDITTLMAKDSIAYFAVIFSVCLFGAIFTFVTERANLVGGSLFLYWHDNRNTYQTIVVTIMTILASKMLIGLRAECYVPVGMVATELFWDAQGVERSNFQTASDSTE